jgi:hypothetical protein
MSFIWLSHQSLILLDKESLRGNNDESMSGDDSVEKEYEAAMKNQNEKNTNGSTPLQTQQDDNDDNVDKGSNGFYGNQQKVCKERFPRYK